MMAQMDEPKPPDPADVERLRRIATPTTVVGIVGTLLFVGVWIAGKAGQDGLWIACMIGSLAALLGGAGLLRRRNWGRMILMALHTTIIAVLAFFIYVVCLPRQVNDPLDEIIPIVMVFWLLYYSIRTLLTLRAAAPLMKPRGSSTGRARLALADLTLSCQASDRWSVALCSVRRSRMTRTV